MKVVVVRNHDRSGVLSTRGVPSPERYSERAVARVAAALADGGHDVVVLEADVTLLDRLRVELPASASDGLVFNMAYGIQGECRYTHVPAMLEMAGVPYTGSSPMGHTLALDKVVTKALISAAGVSTPAHRVAVRAADVSGLRFPVVVKPRHESSSYGLALAADEQEAGTAIDQVVRRYGQAALVEEYVEGREVCVALLGNGDGVRCLPPVEIDFGLRSSRLLTRNDKVGRTGEARRICPAPLDPALRAAVEAAARQTFAAVHCRDYARVDFRLDRYDIPHVLEINSMASLGLGGSFVLAAAAAGLEFTALVNRIVEVAVARERAARAEHEPAGRPRLHAVAAT
jgi:D-alanine-D-alanine ligase